MASPSVVVSRPVRHGESHSLYSLFQVTTGSLPWYYPLSLSRKVRCRSTTVLPSDVRDGDLRAEALTLSYVTQFSTMGLVTSRRLAVHRRQNDRLSSMIFVRTLGMAVRSNDPLACNLVFHVHFVLTSVRIRRGLNEASAFSLAPRPSYCGLDSTATMFQLYDFNIVYCAIATVSAAVGYRYTRRRSERSRASARRSFELRLPSCALPRRRNSDASQTSSDVSLTTESDSSDGATDDRTTPILYESISSVTEPGSLKRKVREEAQASESPHSETALELSSEPPRKRCRTPSDGGVILKEGTICKPTPCEDVLMAPPAGAHGTSEPVDGDSPASTVPPAANPRAVTIPSSFSVPPCRPSDAFSAFAGTSSAFAAAMQATEKPAWCRAGAGPAVAESTEAPPAPSGSEAFDPSAAGADEDGVWRPKAAVVLAEDSPERDPFAAPAWAQSTHVVITGEEDEYVKAELKGAKLFIKRGSGDFTTGMIGHLKLLAHKTDKSERLVFRREPVWKVSMSVGLRPAVRCSFDENQGVLRVSLKEAVSSDSGAAAEQQVVLYVLKRGRVPRDDFTSFSQEVMRSLRAGSTSL